MGYTTNSVGLRVGINRGWKFKSHFSKGGSSSLFFVQMELVDFFANFFEDRIFHKRGMLFSHAVFRPDPELGLGVDVFIYDPAFERHYRKYTTRLLKHRRALKRRFPKIWRSFMKTRRSCVFVFAEFIRERFIDLRAKFYSVIVSAISTRFRRAYPELKFHIRIFPLKARMISAEFLGRFFLMKFLYRRELVQVINPIVKRLTRRFSGMRVDCAGRFTRRQRASFTRITRGRVSLNSLNSRVDFTQVSLPLKFGVCSIKLWLGDRLPVRKYTSDAESDILGGFSALKVPVQRQFSRNFFIGRGSGKSGLRVRLSAPVSVAESAIRIGSASAFRVQMAKRWGIAFKSGAFLSRRIRLLNAYLRRFPSEQSRTGLIKHFLCLSSARASYKSHFFPVKKAEAKSAARERIRRIIRASRRFPRYFNRGLLGKFFREKLPKPSRLVKKYKRRTVHSSVKAKKAPRLKYRTKDGKTNK
jgi:hypothetical protein